MAVIPISIYTQKVDNQVLGYVALSFDSITTTTAITIKAGSKLECSGALYSWGADEVPTAPGGGWVNSTQYYVYFNPTGPNSYYSSAAPTWDYSKQGWYLNIGSTNRCFGRFYRDGSGNYTKKALYQAYSGGANTFNIIPIGVAIPWFGSMTGCPALPDGWWLCDGSTITDPESPLNGQAAPAINNTGRFVRGSTVSGTLQEQATAKNGLSGSAGIPTYPTSTQGFTSNLVGSGTSTQGGTETVGISLSGDAETRPINISAIWVIRIK
jgi:hypothetical protein